MDEWTFSDYPPSHTILKAGLVWDKGKRLNLKKVTDTSQVWQQSEQEHIKSQTDFSTLTSEFF